MKNIKAIIFDAYGTLFDVNSAAEKCKDKIGDKWEGFSNYWRTTQLDYTWLRILMGRHKDFWQITEDSLDKSMKVFEIDSLMKSDLLNLYKILSTFPEVKEVLKSLKDKKYKLAIKVNGCFWHGHEGCKDFRIPKSNVEFWTNKLRGNIDRDRSSHSALEQLGYTIFTIWECDIKSGNLSEIDKAIGFIRRFKLSSTQAAENQ